MVVLVTVTSCGGSSATPAGSAAPAVQPTGPSARSVDYRCTGGRLGTITVAIPDLSKLADVLNPINVCEYDGGLAEVVLTLDCGDSSPARIRLAAVDGKLPATASPAC